MVDLTTMIDGEALSPSYPQGSTSVTVSAADGNPRLIATLEGGTTLCAYRADTPPSPPPPPPPAQPSPEEVAKAEADAATAAAAATTAAAAAAAAAEKPSSAKKGAKGAHGVLAGDCAYAVVVVSPGWPYAHQLGDCGAQRLA